MRLSVEVPALAAAWKITHDKRYADRAGLHLRAWFIDDSTRMNPDIEGVHLSPREPAAGPDRQQVLAGRKLRPAGEAG
jgi:hypothetical protein